LNNKTEAENAPKKKSPATGFEHAAYLTKEKIILPVERIANAVV
jgi:hypothetical protein